MKSYKREGRFAASGWRLIAAASAIAMLCACAERGYLADEGWRQNAAGLTAGQPKPEAIVPALSADASKIDDTIYAALVSVSASGDCSIPRLADGGGDPTDTELRSAFNCTRAAVAPAYAASGHVLVRTFAGWQRITATPFFSDPLGDRYGIVFANARALGQESSDEHFDRGFPVGATLAVPTFTISDTGIAEPGPLVLVEKMEPGFFALQGNWRYTVVDTSGDVVAVTRGLNQDDVSVCANCTHSKADLFYASLLNDGVVPYAEGVGPAFPSIDTYGSSGGLVPPKPPQDGVNGETGFPGEGAIFDPNAPILDPNAPSTDG